MLLNLVRIINFSDTVLPMIRNKKLFNSLLLSSCLLATSVHAASKTHSEPLDRIIAIVNDSAITQSDLNEALRAVKKQITASHTPAPPEDLLRKKVLEQVINRKLQLQLAQQAGIKITDADVNKAIANIAAQNHISAKELLGSLTSQGMSENEYRKELRDELAIQQVEQIDVGSHIAITPQEVDDFMRSSAWLQYNGKEYHLEDILITLPEAPTTQQLTAAKKQAEDVLAKVHSGINFAKLAMEDSGNSGALQGGDLGWRQLPQIPSAFSSQLVHMKVNDVMGPILTPNGYHLVKLSGVRNTGKHESVAIQRKKVEQLIFQRKMEEGIQTWITKLRGAAFINMNPDNGEQKL
jgi:peptidyl-prolyl cis-trans isomerase SurA